MARLTASFPVQELTASQATNANDPSSNMTPPASCKDNSRSHTQKSFVVMDSSAQTDMPMYLLETHHSAADLEPAHEGHSPHTVDNSCCNDAARNDSNVSKESKHVQSQPLSALDMEPIRFDDSTTAQPDSSANESIANTPPKSINSQSVVSVTYRDLASHTPNGEETSEVSNNNNNQSASALKPTAADVGDVDITGEISSPRPSEGSNAPESEQYISPVVDANMITSIKVYSEDGVEPGVFAPNQMSPAENAQGHDNCARMSIPGIRESTNSPASTEKTNSIPSHAEAKELSTERPLASTGSSLTQVATGAPRTVPCTTRAPSHMLSSSTPSASKILEVGVLSLTFVPLVFE